MDLVDNLRCTVCKTFWFIMLTRLTLHETYLFVNKPGNLPAYTSPNDLERGNIVYMHISHPSNIKT